MSNEPLYEKSSQLIDCDKQGADYQKPSYSMNPSCSKNQLDCNNQSYSFYATNSAYQGYYDNCFISGPAVPQCDLTYVNSSPKMNADCWDKCCNKNMKDCNQECHTSCVVNGNEKPKEKK